jgi:hypothetical protein
MAYAGYLIKVGDYIIPHNKIKAQSYSAYANVQDLDSYRDADGVLHRNALEHTPVKVEFETPDMMTNSEFADFVGNIRRNFTNATERKLNASVYIPEYDNYVTQEVYMADIKPKMRSTYGDKIHYEPIRFAFIGY